MIKAIITSIGSLLLLVSVFTFSQDVSPASDQKNIPPILAPWLSWVMDGNEAYNCPFINRTDFNQKKNHICAWPSTLILDVTDEGAMFQQSWQVLEKSYIPLPGSSENWPLTVKVNNELLPVILYRGEPAIALEKGAYKVTGEFNWPSIPESIYIPSQYAFVKMSINGRAIAFPKIEDNDLWLQELEPSQAQHDSIAVTVARRVTDGSHIALDTYLDFNVSGKMREVIVGRALPENIELIGIESELPAFLDADGLLHVKLKPGNWQMLIRGYAKQTLLTWKKPIKSHHWPKEEIWVFKGDESLRIGKLSGGQMIDSNQADMPNAWYTLPSYLLKEGDALSYDIQHRGKPVHIENQLTLNRTLWLSFDGENYTFNDNIRGQMINDWRLSMLSPYILESAEDQDGSVLITSKADEERGIENRYPGTNIKARGIFQAESEIAISGWQSNFERVSLRLNLPPGNKLFAVFGADSVSNSWWGNWTIWASFIVLLSAFVASRIVSVSAGVVTALMLVAIYQESGVPLFAIVNFLLAVAVKTHQPFTSLKTMVNGYWAFSVALVVGTILYFSAMQLRTVIHPQLEANITNVQSFNDRSNAEMNIVTDLVKSRSEKQAFSAQQDVERIEVTGSRIKRADLLMERYQSDAMIQAGSGIPDWQWQPYTINWHSPVTQGQTFDVIVLSKNSYRVVKVLGVLLALLWLVLVLKDNIKLKINKLSSPALVSLLALGLLLPGYSGKVEATNFPTQALLEELQQRVLVAPKCAPSCALINQIKVQSQASQLTITLNVHANAETAIALPKSEFWRPEKLLLNGKPVQSLLKQGRWLYVPVAQGISTFSLSGEIAPVDTFQLEFKDKPQHVELGLNNAWQVVGVQANHLTGNTLAFLSLVNEKVLKKSDTAKENNVSSTRYAYQPFVKVVRELSIDQIWTVTTTVKRIAPSSGSINMQIPTLPGERIISADMVVENAQVNVTLPAGENEFRWNSTLERQALLSLQASATLPLVEQWQIIVNPSWHADISGIPMILGAQESDDYYSYLFYPYPGETLTIATSRPNAVKGEILAIDKVNVDIEQGTRTSKLNLSFDYRSTRGGEHHIELPDSYQLKEIRTDNKLINLQLEQGKLALPILPGKHTIQISMRSNTSDELLLTVPTINLHAPVSNITSVVNLTRQRWVLWTDGPILGPAVLYWGELLAFILLAILVARIPFSPLTLMSWIALGFGLSLNNWGILMLVAVWFASLTASTYRPKNLNRIAFNFSQFILYGLSIVTVLALIAVIPTSLLSSPNMGITGNYSFGNNLQWFADKSDGLLPDITVFSIPVLFYKGLMLAWVIWLSFTSLSWIKWAWGKLGAQGYWRAKQQSVAKTPTSKEQE